MKIRSLAFEDGDKIPRRYARRGEDISPPLEFANAPKEAKSLALICHDPDAPIEGGYTHWVVWNLPPDLPGIEAGALPADAVEGMTDWGVPGWGGPQPPSGVHRYIFYLYALDRELDLPTSTDKTELEQIIKPHILAQAKLIGLFDSADN